jgi:hypothetical protein
MEAALKFFIFAVRVLATVIVLVGTMGTPSLAWPESVEITARRGQISGIMKMLLYGDFCQRAYIGKIAVRPDPQLGSLIFKEGEEEHPELGCKDAKIPFTGILYKAGAKSGDDKFTLYVSDGWDMQAIKVTVHVR